MKTRTINCLEVENCAYAHTNWLMGYGIPVSPVTETQIVKDMTPETSSQLHILYQEYHPHFDPIALKKLNTELRNIVIVTKEKASLADIITDAMTMKPITAYGQWLKEIIIQIEATISGMDDIISCFFGEEVIKTAAENGKTTAILLAETIMTGYSLCHLEEEKVYKVTSQMSLQNIMQWAIETYAIKNIYHSVGGKEETLPEFMDRLYRIMFEKDTNYRAIGEKILGHIANRADVSAYYLKNILISMMKNHSYVTMIKMIEEKKQNHHVACANDNYIDTLYQDDERLFNILHIGTNDSVQETHSTVSTLSIGGESLQNILLNSMNHHVVPEKEIHIHNKKYIISVEQSEDFENTAYDVTIVTMKDYETGCVIGSMSVSENITSTGTKTFVAYKSPDISDFETEQLKIEEFMPNKISDKRVTEELADNME